MDPFCDRIVCETVLYQYSPFRQNDTARSTAKEYKELNGGQGRNRTTDTRIFSPQRCHTILITRYLVHIYTFTMVAFNVVFFSKKIIHMHIYEKEDGMYACSLIQLKLNHAHTNSIEICTTAYALKF